MMSTDHQTTIAQIIAVLYQIAPAHLCMDGDPHGLLIGDPDAPVSHLVVSLDVTPAVVDEAVRRGAQMIVAHHPLIYNPIRRLVADGSFPGGVVLTCARAGIAVACAHTNWDIAEGGINDVLAGLLNLRDTRPVRATYRESLVNITLYVPLENRAAVFAAMTDAGAGFLTGSLYDQCGFWATGTGTFQPRAGADPYVTGPLTENRLEMLAPAATLPQILAAMRASHPYEEVAYNVFPLANTGKEWGIGRVGTLTEPMTRTELLQRVRTALGFDAVRFRGGDEDAPIRTVAVGGGACAFLVEDAIRQGADALITSDVRHHEFVDAEARGFLLVDAGHRETETPGTRELARRLGEELPELTVDFL